MPQRFEVQIPLIAEADIVGSGLLEFVGDTDNIVGQRVRPSTRPRSGLRPDARSVQPPDRGLPAERRAGRRRLRRPAADGGLRAVRPDAGRTAPARSTWPSRWSGTGSAHGLQAPRRHRPCCVLSCGCSASSGGRDSPSRPEYVRNVLVRGGYRLVPWWLRRAVYRPVVAQYTEQGEQPKQRTAVRPPGAARIGRAATRLRRAAGPTRPGSAAGPAKPRVSRERRPGHRRVRVLRPDHRRALRQ